MELQFLVNEVMDEASKKHGRTFSSKSQAYADILEEYQECFEELENVEGFLKKVWNGKRNDNIDLIDIEQIKRHALLLVEEALQVAGLCDKYTKSFNENIIPKTDLMNQEEFLNYEFEIIEGEKIFYKEKICETKKGTGTARDCGFCFLKEECKEGKQNICKDKSIYFIEA